MSTRREFIQSMIDGGIGEERIMEGLALYRDTNGAFDDEIETVEKPRLDIDAIQNADEIRADYMRHANPYDDPKIAETNYRKSFIRAHYNNLDGDDYKDDEKLIIRASKDFHSDDLDTIYTELTETYKLQTMDRREDSIVGVSPSEFKRKKRDSRRVERSEMAEKYVSDIRQSTMIGQAEMRGGNSFIENARKGELTGGMKDHFQQGGWDTTQNLKATNAGISGNREALIAIQSEDKEIGELSKNFMTLEDSGFWNKAFKGASGSSQAMVESLFTGAVGSTLGPWGGKAATTAYWQRQGAGTFIRSAIADRDLSEISDEDLKTINGLSQFMGVPYALVELLVNSVPGIKATGLPLDRIITNGIIKRIGKNPAIVNKLATEGTAFAMRWILESVEEGLQGGVETSSEEFIDKLLDGDPIAWQKVASDSVSTGVQSLPATLIFSGIGLPSQIKEGNKGRRVYTKKQELVSQMPLAQAQKDIATAKLDKINTAKDFKVWLDETTELAIQTLASETPENIVVNSGGVVENLPVSDSDKVMLTKAKVDLDENGFTSLAEDTVRSARDLTKQTDIVNPETGYTALDVVSHALSDITGDNHRALTIMLDNGNIEGIRQLLSDNSDKMDNGSVKESPVDSRGVPIDTRKDNRSIEIAEVLVNDWQVNSKAKATENSGYNALITPFTDGQFDILGEDSDALLGALERIDPASVELLLRATTGDVNARKEWNQQAKVLRLQSKVAEGETISPNEQQILEDYDAQIIEDFLNPNKDLAEVDQQAIDNTEERTGEGNWFSKKVMGWTGMEGISLSSRMLGWTGGINFLNKHTPQLANDLQKYFQQTSRLYNANFDEANVRSSLNEFNRVEAIVNRLKVKPQPEYAEVLKAYDRAKLRAIKGKGFGDLGGVVIALAKVAEGRTDKISVLINNTVTRIENDYGVEGLEEAVNGLSGVLNDLTSDKTDDPQFDMFHVNSRFKPIVDPKKTEEFIARSGQDITKADTFDSRVSIEKLELSDMDLFLSIGATIERNLKDEAELQARRTFFGDQSIDNKYDVEGSSVPQISLDNIRKREEIVGLNPKAKAKIDSLVQSAVESKSNSTLYKAVKFLSKNKVSKLSTAIKNLGDLGRTFVMLQNMAGTEDAVKALNKQIVKRFVKGLPFANGVPLPKQMREDATEVKTSIDKFFNDNADKTYIKVINGLIDGTVKVASGVKSTIPTYKQYNADGEVIVPKSSFTKDGKVITPSLKSIGADIFDLDADIKGEIQLNYWTYLNEARKDRSFQWQTRESSFKQHKKNALDFWNEGQLSILQSFDLNMKDITLNSAVDIFTNMDAETRVKTLTDIMRGDSKTAKEVSDAFDSGDFSEEVRTMLYQYVNLLQPLNVLDRATFFLEHPEFGVFRSFESKQVGLMYDKTIGNHTKAREYRKVGMKIQAKLEKAHREYEAMVTLEADPLSYNAEAKTAKSTEVAKLKKQRNYAAEQQTMYENKVKTDVSKHMIMFNGIDTIIEVGIDAIRGLFDDDRETALNAEGTDSILWMEFEANMGTHFARAYAANVVDNLTPVISLGFLLDNQDYGDLTPAEAMWEDATSTVLPSAISVIDDIYKASRKQDATKLYDATSEIPIFGDIIYDQLKYWTEE